MSASGPRGQPTLFELSKPGRGGDKVPHPPHDALDRLPAEHRRERPPALPELNEPDVVRHYVNLSQLNHAVDTGFYPLGSCTMKWNAKVNEWAARLPGFAQLHPMAPDDVAQGTLQLLWELEHIRGRILQEVERAPQEALDPSRYGEFGLEGGAGHEREHAATIRRWRESRGL